MATSYRALADDVSAVGVQIPELSFASVRSGDLAARLDRAHAAGGHTVLVSGPAGSGKTVALVDWVTRSRKARAATVGWLTVTARLADSGELLPTIARLLHRPADGDLTQLRSCGELHHDHSPALGADKSNPTRDGDAVGFAD